MIQSRTKTARWFSIEFAAETELGASPTAAVPSGRGCIILKSLKHLEGKAHDPDCVAWVRVITLDDSN